MSRKSLKAALEEKGGVQAYADPSALEVLTDEQLREQIAAYIKNRGFFINSDESIEIHEKQLPRENEDNEFGIKNLGTGGNLHPTGAVLKGVLEKLEKLQSNSAEGDPLAPKS